MIVFEYNIVPDGEQQCCDDCGNCCSIDAACRGQMTNHGCFAYYVKSITMTTHLSVLHIAFSWQHEL